MPNKLNFSLTQLEYVLAVHKYGHFAKAAKHCFVTQPTLSMQIHKLETDLGIALFDRSKKPILLTDKGKKIIEQMQNVVLEAKKIESLLQLSKSNILSGELNIGVIPTIAPYLLPLLLPEIEKKYPGVELRIFELQTHKIIESLEDDEIHVGILATPLKIEKIHEQPLYWEPFYLLANQSNPLAKLKKVKYSQLNSNDVWLLEEGHCLRHQILDVCSMKQKNKSRKFQFESGSMETLKNLVNSYGGYTLLPYLSTLTHGKQSQLIPFEKPVPAREIGLVSIRNHYKNELIQALAKSIQAAIPDQLLHYKEKELDVVPIE